MCEPVGGACVAKPDFCDQPGMDLCEGKECGPNGCGGSCGDCESDETCNPSVFQCVSLEQDMECSGTGEFLCPCDVAEDCVAEFCVPGPQGYNVCTRLCIDGCPADWACDQWIAALPDVVYVCVLAGGS